MPTPTPIPLFPATPTSPKPRKVHEHDFAGIEQKSFGPLTRAQFYVLSYVRAHARLPSSIGYGSRDTFATIDALERKGFTVNITGSVATLSAAAEYALLCAFIAFDKLIAKQALKAEQYEAERKRDDALFKASTYWSYGETLPDGSRGYRLMRVDGAGVLRRYCYPSAEKPLGFVPKDKPASVDWRSGALIVDSTFIADDTFRACFGAAFKGPIQ